VRRGDLGWDVDNGLRRESLGERLVVRCGFACASISRIESTRRRNMTDSLFSIFSPVRFFLKEGFNPHSTLDCPPEQVIGFASRFRFPFLRLSSIRRRHFPADFGHAQGVEPCSGYKLFAIATALREMPLAENNGGSDPTERSCTVRRRACR
jgi:hypothetical protein